MYEKTIEVDGQPVVIRELTVQDIRGWLIDLRSAAEKEPEILSVDRDLFEDLPLDDLARFTDLTRDQIDAMTPGNLRQVIDAVRTVNQDFFAMRARMNATARAFIGLLSNSSKISSAPSAQPSSTATP